MRTDLETLLSCQTRFLWQTSLELYDRAIASDLLHKIVETFITKLLVIALGLITSVIVARVLGPEGRGLYAVAATIGGIGVQFGNLGLHASNTYYVSRDRTLLPVLLANSIIASFLFGTICIAFIWFLFFFWPSAAPLRGLLLILSLIWIPFGLAYMLLQNLLLGIQEVSNYNKIELATKILGLSLIILVVCLLNVTVENVFLTGLVTLAIGFIWAFSRLKRYPLKAMLPSIILFKKNIFYGLKAYLAAFFAFMVIRSDLLIIKYMLGAEQTGFYSIAASMAEMLYLLPSVVGTILFPKLSALNNVRDRWNLTKKVSVCTGVGLSLLLVGAGFFAEPIVRLLFGRSFALSVFPFLCLLPGILFLGVETVQVQFLNSVGFPITVVAVWGFTCFASLGLNLAVIPKYGIIGASAVSSISYFIAFLLVLWISKRARTNHE